MNDPPVLSLKNVCKQYFRGSETVNALNGISLDILSGEYSAVVGPSGSGKTTLLNIMGCLDRPTSGSLSVNGTQVQSLSEKRLTRMRQTSIGFVFQQFFLLPTLTVLENVQIPSLFAKKDTKELAGDLLSLVGLEKRLHHLPGQLSGGEMQRVAVARSLINSPGIVLADEPTGNLDSRNAGSIMSLFDKLVAKGITLVVVTHNPELARRCGRTINIEDGKLSC